MSINPIDIKYFKNNNLLPKIYEVNSRIERGEIEILRKDIIKLKEQIKILTELVLMNLANKKYEKEEEEKEPNKFRRHYTSYIPYLFPIPFYFLYKYYK